MIDALIGGWRASQCMVVVRNFIISVATHKVFRKTGGFSNIFQSFHSQEVPSSKRIIQE